MTEGPPTDTSPTGDVAALWPATGVGSLPGVDPGVAARMVAQETPDLPYLPELPARGPGADMIGRGLSLLWRVSSEFSADTGPTGWRLGPAGRPLRRGRSYLSNDIDALAEELPDYRGPITVTLPGPWTLAASVEDRRGERILRDRGLVRDLATALGHAAVELLRDAGRAVPGGQWRVQLDEPALMAVADGRLPTASGYSRHLPVPANDMAQMLTGVVDLVGATPVTLHTCARVPFDVLLATPLTGLAFDITRHRLADDEALGTWLESGRSTTFGVWRTDGGSEPADPRRAAEAILAPLYRLGLHSEAMPGPVALSPRCGLAAVPPATVPATFSGLRALGRHLADPDS